MDRARWPARTPHLRQDDASSGAEALGAGRPDVVRTKAWIMLALLTALYTCSFIDRQAIVFIVDPIRRDLHISDTQIGLLLGPAFAILFAIVTIPMGMLVDRFDRVWLVAAGVTLWSAMTAAGGIATSFGMLFACRMGVGLGEAALTPAAYSLVSDLFPERSRGLALSIYSAGISLGGGVAAIAGGYVVKAAMTAGPTTLPILGATAPWQMAFLAVGLPGFLLAIAITLLGDAPRREPGPAFRSDAPSALSADRVGSMAALIGAAALLTAFGFGVAAWLPTHFMRVLHMPVSRVGLAYGGGIILCGLPGTLLCGYLSMILVRRGRDDAAHILAAATGTAALAFAAAAIGAPTAFSATLALFGFLAFGGVWNGAVVAALQAIAPPTARGRVSALYLLGLNLVGQGLGPFLVAWLADHAFHGVRAIGMALLTLGVIATPAAILLLMVGRPAYLRTTGAIERSAPDSGLLDTRNKNDMSPHSVFAS